MAKYQNNTNLQVNHAFISIKANQSINPPNLIEQISGPVQSQSPSLYDHKEIIFQNFNKQVLLPHKFS